MKSLSNKYTQKKVYPLLLILFPLILLKQHVISDLPTHSHKFKNLHKYKCKGKLLQRCGLKLYRNNVGCVLLTHTIFSLFPFNFVRGGVYIPNSNNKRWPGHVCEMETFECYF